jgi:hypothetical protein
MATGWDLCLPGCAVADCLSVCESSFRGGWERKDIEIWKFMRYRTPNSFLVGGPKFSRPAHKTSLVVLFVAITWNLTKHFVVLIFGTCTYRLPSSEYRHDLNWLWFTVAFSSHQDWSGGVWPHSRPAWTKKCTKNCWVWNVSNMSSRSGWNSRTKEPRSESVVARSR